MSGQTKFWSFILVFLLMMSCSSCAWLKSNGEWSYKKRDLKNKILKNSNDYNANYTLGITYALRGKKFLIPSTNWKKKFLKRAIPYLEQAIRIKPDSAEAHLALGEIFGNDKINDGFGAIRHTVIAKKLFERKKNIEGLAIAKANLQFFSKKFFSFDILGFTEIQIPEPS
jgi:hypothetical protein